MKAVIHANIDGYEIVLGFGEAFRFIDTIATYRKIAPLLECPEQRRWNELLRSGRGESYLRISEPELEEVLAKIRQKLIGANAVYARPPQGEELIADDQAATLWAAFAERGETRQLLMTGEYIDDLRGREYWVKGEEWTGQRITGLGEKPAAGAIPADLLTDAQRAEIAEQQEAERLQNMSPVDRAAEIERLKQGALAQAAHMRSELEIAGDPEALAKSQTWYQRELANIGAK